MAFLSLFILLLLSLPLQVSAHAYVVTSNPEENEILEKAPETVTIEFNETIQKGFNSLIVRNEEGKRVDLKDAYIDPQNKKIFHTGLEDGLKDGVYTVEWRVVSADGHSVRGLIPFGIGTAEKIGKLHVEQEHYVPPADIIIHRIVTYTSFSLFIGVILFVLFLYKQADVHHLVRKRSQLLMRISLIGIAVSILLSMPLQITKNANVSWLKAFNPLLIKEAIVSTTAGYIWVIQVVVLVLLIITAFFAGKTLFSMKRWILPFILYSCLLIGEAVNGHAGGSAYKEFVIGLDFLHILSAAIWVGGLASIFLIVRGNKNLLRESIISFSPIAMYTVITLFFSGILNSVFFIPSLNALVTTDYGRAFLIKVGLFLIMLIFGVLHFIRGKKTGNKKTIGTELMIGVVIVIVTAVLTNLPTPVPEPKPFIESYRFEDMTEISVEITPNTAGINTFNVSIQTVEGEPIENIEQVTIAVSKMNEKEKEKTFQVQNVEPGFFTAKGLYLTSSGRHKIQVHVLTKSLETYDHAFYTRVGK
ncbi:copper resistance CopC/CopD family protein [Metabacillus fastidiosus]|uniref:copper resistance CopC/CopD family protein n=1 Tax=Metabacillus fastidiosus TaxID=1458 RepID=UPI000824012F|nr:copper resistance CopC/CopD family protein [Metabacillus fastidiosus]MED4463670.1 copper resistance CopC/CopD family protein [Metabacillus fastidiosus]